ncbi:MAG: TerB family tellurite resistance protein [Gammaproteobacteria bacterium]|nr:TerB family tellurite resistance protein [Gammaproteobacteria bacterium]
MSPSESADETNRLKTYELASAALMVELMETDHQLDERESREFIAVLEETLELDHGDIEEIVELATNEAQQATSLYEFTRLINDNYEYNEKVKLIENLWRIAFADEKLDKYEENLIRRLAGLIHVSHSDFIQTKLRVKKPAG